MTIANSSADVFDLQSVLDMVDGELDFVRDLVDMYLSNFPEQNDELRAAFAAGDAEKVRKVAHRLKSSTGNLGGRRAQAAVVELEYQAMDGQLDGADALFAQCQTELGAFEQTLRAFLANG